MADKIAPHRMFDKMSTNMAKTKNPKTGKVSQPEYDPDTVGEYNKGQFDEGRNSNFIKLNTPEGETKEDLAKKKERSAFDAFTSDAEWEKKCEWRKKSDFY